MVDASASAQRAGYKVFIRLTLSTVLYSALISVSSPASADKYGADPTTERVCVGGKYEGQSCMSDEEVSRCRNGGGKCLPEPQAVSVDCTYNSTKKSCTCKCSGLGTKSCADAMKASCKLATNCNDGDCSVERGCTWTDVPASSCPTD